MSPKLPAPCTLLLACGLVLSTNGCFNDVWARGQALFPTTDATSSAGSTSSCTEVDACTTGASGTASNSGESENGSGGGTASTMTTTWGTGSTSSVTMTTTWGGTGEGPGSGGEEVLPVEVEVFVSPSPALAVGEVQISVSTSRPVTSIDLYDGDVPLVLGAAPPVHVLEVTSEKTPGDGPHTIRAVAHAFDGGVGEGEAPLMIDVQPGGSDVWTPFVQAGPINGFTSAALRKHGIDTAGFFETNQGIQAVAVRIDGTTGLPQGGPIVLGPVAASGGGRGPAVAVGGDATFVAWTQPSGPTTRWAVSRVVFGEAKGPVWSGPPKTAVHALAVVGNTLVLAGSLTTGAGTHDLGVWWVAADTGELVASRSFAATAEEDPQNTYDEVGRGVAIVDDEVVVVGERMIWDPGKAVVRRTVILRHTLDGEPLDEWTSPGEHLEEDAAMAVAPLRAGGFVTVGWGRDKGSIREVMTRWFSADGEMVAMRIEPTPSNDAVGFAVGEDREGKIVIAGTLQQPKTDTNAWIFAVPGPVGAPTWEVIRNGPGQGPDEAAGLAVDAWGYAYVVGSEFDALQPQAFALRLYP